MKKINLFLPILTLTAFLLSSGNLYSQVPAPDVKVKTEQKSPDFDNFDNLLKTNTIEIIEWAKQTAQKTGDFAAEQTPLFIKEYIAWTFWSNLIKVITLLIITSIALFFGIKLLKRGVKDNNENFGVSGVFLIVLGVVCFSGLCFGNNIQNMVKAKIAPRVLIVEKISELVKK